MPPKIKGLTFAPGGHVPVKPRPAPKKLPAPGHGNIAGPPLPAPGHGPIAGPPAPARRPAAPVRRPTPQRRSAARARQPKITVADLVSTDPFSSARRATRQRVNTLRSTLPNRPELLSVPVLPHYTPRQRDIILREQAPRIQRIMRATGTRGNPRALLDTLNPHDALQVRIFAELAHHRSSPVSTDIRQRIARRMLAEGMSRSEVAQILAHPPTARAGRPRSVLGSAVHVAGVDLPMALVGHDFASRFNELGRVGSAVGELAGPSYRDARDLIIQTPNSLYQLGAAGVGILKYAGTSYPGARGHDSGDLEPARRIAEGMTQGFIGHLARGDVKGAGRYFAEHPLFSALEVSGAKSLAGRSAGAAMRSGALGAGARSAASMRRAPLVDPYGRVLEARRYPADVLTKARIVAGERLADRRGRRSNVSRPSIVPYRGLRQASASMVDEYAAMAEGTRRLGRDAAMRRLGATLPGRGRGRVGRVGDRLAPTSLGRVGDLLPSRVRGRITRPERDILQAVVEGRVSPSRFAAELRAERDRLNTAYVRGTNRRAPDYEPMSGPAALANRQQVRAIERVLRSPRALANVRGVAQSARRYRAMADRVEHEAIRRGLLDPDQALAAKVRPYAVAKMGARYDRRRTPPEHMAHRYDQAQQLERRAAVTVARAREAERTAGQAAGAARRELATARARAAGVTARAQLLSEQARRAGRAQPQRTLAVLQRERAAWLAAEHRLRAAAGALRTAREGRRAAEGGLRQATRVRRGANPKRYVTGLVGRDGRRLSTDEILAHMGANGVDLPAFVSHRMDTAGARSFFVNWFGRRQTLDGAGVRTGRATELGAHGSAFTSLAEQHVRAQGVVDAVRNFDGFVRRFGIKRRDGEMFTWHEGQRIAEDPALIGARDSHGNPIPGYDELVPMRAVPARYSDATRRAVADLQDATRMPNLSGLVERRFAEMMDAPSLADAGRVRNVVLVPRAELERFVEHQTKGAGAATRAGQVVSNAFRRTVLPFSVKWLTGNTVEAALRLAIVGAGPNSWRIGRRLLSHMEEIDAAGAAELRARTLGGLLYGGGDRLIVHRTAESFRDSPALGSVAGGAAVLRRAPIVKQSLDGIKLYQDAVFRFNRAIEQHAQTAALGKEARQQMQEMSGSWWQATRAARPAFDDLLRGARETPNQVRFARMLDETLGKYSRFSPGMRRFIQGYAPFLPWYLNAARFVLWTLPTKHPVKVALATRLQQTFEEDFKAQHEGVPPGDLQAAVRRSDGGLVPLARYMPFGAFTDLPRGLLEPLLPQISSVQKAVEGRSFTGEKLRVSDSDVSEGDKRLIAVNAMFEALVPGLSIVRRIREGGSTPWDDSTIFTPRVKPGTGVRGGAARRILDPFRPVYLGGGPRKAAPRGSGSVGSDGLDWSSAAGAATGEALDWGAAVVQ